MFAVTPHSGSNTCGVGEVPIIGEVDTARTSAPVTGTNPSLYGVETESRLARLRERNHAVLFTEIFIEHSCWTRHDNNALHSRRFRRARVR
jgi:hypothetical protein